ncbi:GNAT family N-acetyltransferase [Patescibacteria group bacterium]|nr:GNAT family N-acetyltransferase [Patescibacteria group bacterium]
MIQFFLEGKRIFLRPLETKDLNDNYQNWFNDAEICNFNDHHRFPNYKENMEEYYNSVIKSKISLVLAIIDKETGKHIGNITLQSIDNTNRSAEFAIIIGDKESWGKGIGKEAGELIINHGFNELNLHRIYCGTSTENKGMQKLAMSLGFKEEGIQKEALYKHGKYVDIINYGLVRNDV